MADTPWESPWEVADRAASVLAPESSVVADSDVADFGRSLARAAVGAAAHPLAATEASARFATDLAKIPLAALGRLVGADVPPPLPVDPKDRRFADPTWTENPAFYALRQAYLATARLTEQLIDAAGLDSRTDAKARMVSRLMLDAVAPTNFLLTNPAALKKALETGGTSVLKGARNALDDLLHNGGRPRQVDSSPFRLGENMAATPAKVVYRNDLMELLQYEPQTERVHAKPLLASPPWINKYYVMDLAPGRSFIEWAVRHNRTVFAISYRNASPEMSRITMDDYLIKGPRQALDVIQEITGADAVDIVGLCLGGALTAITAAFLTQAGDSRVGNLTLLNTLLDYSQPGALGVFTDEATVDRLEQQMARKGHLEGSSMAGTFDMLRANDLIFNYVVSNWLLGQDPPAFDILAWNADSTRMPAAMHAFYLRNFYVQNKLAKGELEIAGRTIDLGDIKQDAYVVSAQNDHIVLWRAAYAATRLMSGSVRFVLSSGGHIAGIVNPPGPKGWYLLGDSLPASPDEWREQASRQAGSWWEDWARWSAEHAGELVDPPPMGSEQHPVLYPGPGEYVRT
ncbi:MAG TPA: alpha/beta fold hydrolase [Mycobacteriales bacterium]|nr:alpha/beta fold hydrolase [Mycobacteriales bacterium]